MKKNVIMRAACVVLVLTLLSTCVISGTFAKYVTEAPTVSDDARVAKWGVTVTAAAENLFANTYKSVAQGNNAGTYTANETSNDITVMTSVEAEELVAPGTTGTVEDVITVAGTPEVDVLVDIDATASLTGWEIDLDKDPLTPAEFYCPLVFTITKADATTIEVKQTAEVNTAAKFADALVAAINGLDGTAGAEGKIYHTNTVLDDEVFANVDISWVWDFDAAGAGTNDAKDTALGDLAAAGTNSTIELSYGAKVTQID